MIYIVLIYICIDLYSIYFSSSCIDLYGIDSYLIYFLSSCIDLYLYWFIFDIFLEFLYWFILFWFIFILIYIVLIYIVLIYICIDLYSIYFSSSCIDLYCIGLYLYWFIFNVFLQFLYWFRYVLIYIVLIWYLMYFWISSTDFINPYESSSYFLSDVRPCAFFQFSPLGSLSILTLVQSILRSELPDVYSFSKISASELCFEKVARSSEELFSYFVIPLFLFPMYF